MSEYQILKQALKNNSMDETADQARAVMLERIVRLRASNQFFSGVEVSGDILAMNCDKIAIA